MTIANSIAKLTKLEKNYKPNLLASNVLRGKKLVLFVGPAKIGKSTLMNELTRRDTRFSRIGGFTTRDPRPDDEPELYRYMPYNASSFAHILRQVKAGELAQYAIHPTTGNIYATELSDYGGEYNCKDVLGHAMAGFRALPSAGSLTFSVVCEPTQWLQRMNQVYTDTSDPDLQKRLAEAKINLAWSLQDEKTIWIDNSDGQLQTATDNIIRIITTNEKPNQDQQAKLRVVAEVMLNKL